MDVVTLPADDASPAAARRMARETLAGVSAEVCDAVVLMTSELVANVVRHANTDVRVRIEVGPPIRVEVHDGVAATDAFRELISTRPAPVPSHAAGGRGLALVHALASRIGLGDDPLGGKVVWFEVDVTVNDS